MRRRVLCLLLLRAARSVRLHARTVQSVGTAWSAPEALVLSHGSAPLELGLALLLNCCARTCAGWARLLHGFSGLESACATDSRLTASPPRAQRGGCGSDGAAPTTPLTSLQERYGARKHLLYVRRGSVRARRAARLQRAASTTSTTRTRVTPYGLRLLTLSALPRSQSFVHDYSSADTVVGSRLHGRIYHGFSEERVRCSLVPPCRA